MAVRLIKEVKTKTRFSSRVMSINFPKWKMTKVETGQMWLKSPPIRTKSGAKQEDERTALIPSGATRARSDRPGRLSCCPTTRFRMNWNPRTVERTKKQLVDEDRVPAVLEDEEESAEALMKIQQ